MSTQRDTASDERNRVRFPPDPTTDLQKLARSSTGQALPVFGRDLFQEPPSTFAPADQIPVAADYVIGPGDDVLVRISGAEQISSNSQLTVDASGKIYVPRVGAIQVAGLRANELQTQIAREIDHYFRNYQLSVSLGRLRSIQIYVVGEARRPGAYTISGLSTVLNALFASGGPNVQGSMRRIQVRRGDKTITTLDLYDLILSGDKSHDIRLETGDTLFIPAVGPQVALAGSVRHPAVYELKEDIAGQGANTLGDLLTVAGGLGPTANPGQIRLERIDANLQRHAVTVALDTTGKMMPLHDGDILYANHIASGFEKTVTIRGNLANPGRFAWKPGMRLSDVLPDREALLTGDYWRERNRMGVPTPLFEPNEFNSPPSQGASTDSAMMRAGIERSPNGQANSARNALTSVLPPSAFGEDQEQATVAASGVVSQSATQMDRNATAEAASSKTNLGTSLFGQLGQPNQQQQQLDGSVQQPQQLQQQQLLLGQQQQQQQKTQQPVTATLTTNIIRIPAPEIDWSYAVVERLDPATLKTVLVPFNLGRLVQDHDPTQNLELQPGDVITILNQRDILVPQAEQTKFVRLEGEFSGAGVYSVQPGETLDQLVKRAGGFTSSAYLYGSSFQRESTRVFQQQRLDEYITRLSADMDRQTAVRGASTSTGVSDPNALVLERNLVAQLRELRATGRIVFEFSPDSVGVDALPHIPLENGDVFRVPTRPSTVSVIGAVYGQNVFLYNSQRHLSDYLSLAGRPTRIADKDHAFIVRADGSIYSREKAKGVWSNHFDSSFIYPGDTVVIPEKPISPSVTKRLLDYAQILSSFGLAVAAINVIK
ncbi:polysaccharide biosynthesis/export family protein [Terriglobus roseus]|uniref:Protein involved in polysaccharide export, contains SLBB domain of the beta-grasp fold n=1 Tax=Terriglobus roseus TaxID=392734 RepID=A0A1G7NBL2_9BACT|nr:SLBB domain-containing protein [Terriglobus roseus]SDF71485.1 protein involved in polysaccharide export, contains SLBB domain of the beta-grasp fold [Terriglobus roseus]